MGAGILVPAVMVHRVMRNRLHVLCLVAKSVIRMSTASSIIRKMATKKMEKQINVNTSAACMPYNNGQLLSGATPIANACSNVAASPVATVAVSMNGTPINTVANAAACGVNSNNNNNNNINMNMNITMTPNIYGAPPMISPTFIEHKYSANTFKEKFLANLRANQNAVNKSNMNNNNNNNNNCSSNNNKNINNKQSTYNNNNNNNNDNNLNSNINANAIGNDCDDGAGGGTLGQLHTTNVPTIGATHSIDDIIQQQFSENYNRKIMYQKTIN
ncbi:unnamed protein product [Ceratitis capitata]|uniref:(Mediterranean fruit fly) hypothetical protein n=1 Tax=Ceratitis capitata TaxID=7213 RepID=A0A811U806_CERCA|nr:unnamed protein product [Ceratitis capitata]